MGTRALGNVVARPIRMQVSEVDLQPLLQQAVVDVDEKQDAIAARLGVHPSYLTRMLTGEKPLDLDRLEEFPPDVIAQFGVRIVQRYGYVVRHRSDRREVMARMLAVLGEAVDAFADEPDEALHVPAARKAGR